MPIAKRRKSTVKFVEDIQKEMELTLGQAAKRFGFPDKTAFKQFKAAKHSLNAKYLMQLFAECPDDAERFLERIAHEVGVDISHKKKKRKK